MATMLHATTTASDIGGGKKADLVGTTGSATSVTNTSATPPVVCTDTGGGTQLVWYTKALDAVTINGTITYAIGSASESSMNANAGLSVKVERCNGSGTVLSTISSKAQGVELPTAAANQTWTDSAPTGTTLSAGDRLKFTVSLVAAGGSMASGFTASWSYGDNSTATFSFTVQFTETITEYTAPTTFSRPLFQPPLRRITRRRFI